MQQSVARGMQAAGENPNGGIGAMAFMGMGANSVGIGGLNQPTNQGVIGIQNPNLAPNQVQNPNVASQQNIQGVQANNPINQMPSEPAESNMNGQPVNVQEEDPYEKLSKFKKMLDEGLITQEDYDAQKKKILGV